MELRQQQPPTTTSNNAGQNQERKDEVELRSLDGCPTRIIDNPFNIYPYNDDVSHNTLPRNPSIRANPLDDSTFYNSSENRGESALDVRSLRPSNRRCRTARGDVNSEADTEQAQQRQRRREHRRRRLRHGSVDRYNGDSGEGKIILLFAHRI